MTDSGVDTSNESSDNSVVSDFQKCDLELVPSVIPLGPTIGLGSIDLHDWQEPRGTHHIGKIKCSTHSRHSRTKCKYAGIINYSRNQKLRFAVSTNNVELVEKLLNAGADPNASDDLKRSPLHLAACRGYKDVVKCLIKYGANPNIRDSVGNTPLHLAACTSHIPVVIELLDAGTDVTSNDKYGRTPIQLAQSKLKLIKFMPATSKHTHETKQLVDEIHMIVEMLMKYMKIRKEDTTGLEAVRQRLSMASIAEREPQSLDSEVQCLLNSLDELKLK